MIEMKKLMAVTLAVTALFGAVASAHEGHDHAAPQSIKGTVKAVSDKALTLTTLDGKEVTLAVVADTKVLRGKQASTAADIQVGEKAVVDPMGSAEAGDLHAMSIKLGKKPASKGATTDAGAKTDGGTGTAHGEHGKHEH